MVVCAGSGTLGNTLPAGSAVYILGDSITVGTAPAYTAAFQAKGITTTIDGSSSRSISGAGIDGNRLSGLAAVEQDKSAITAADVIVIALGTNGGNDAQKIDSLIAAIRTHNTNAATKIYWVDTTVINRPSYTTVIQNSNRAIYSEATTQNYTVISWFKTVTPTGDPQNLTGTETDTNAYINLADSINVHPTPKGSSALAQLVVNTVAGSGGAPAPGGGCASQISGTPLSGNNEADVYAFLRAHGLSAVQAAGFMGNLQAEGHFDPKLVQYTTPMAHGGISRGPPACNLADLNDPTCHDDTLLVNGVSGYGIAQWTTTGRQQNLLNFAASRQPPTIAGNLTTQLEFLWQELTTGYNSSTLTPLLATTDLRTATDIVLKHFECPRACVNVIQNPNPVTIAAYGKVLGDRLALAQAILLKYGST